MERRELEKMIQKVGIRVPKANNGRSKNPVYEVCCQICGGAIRSDNISEVEYIESRRGTKQFFHGQCLKRGKTDG